MHSIGKVNTFYLYLRIYKLVNNDNYKNLNQFIRVHMLYGELKEEKEGITVFLCTPGY